MQKYAIDVVQWGQRHKFFHVECLSNKFQINLHVCHTNPVIKHIRTNNTKVYRQEHLLSKLYQKLGFSNSIDLENFGLIDQFHRKAANLILSDTIYSVGNSYEICKQATNQKKISSISVYRS